MRGALVIMVLGLAACGRKTRPLPPELVQPERPAVLAAVAAPDGVRLTWRRPERYTSGKRMNDLGGFVIERATGEGAPEAFTTTGRVELDDQTRFRKETRIEWVDHDVTPGMQYRYRVTAFTVDGYRSRSAGPVAIRFEPAAEPTAPPKKDTP